MEIYIPAASKILHKTGVDFASRALPKVLHIVQYDNKLPVLEVQLFANSTPYTIPENAVINLRFKKKDKTFVIIQAAGCDESRQVVYFEVSNQMTVDHGFFYSVIEVSIGEEIAASGYFGIEIDRNPVQDDDVKSTYEFKALEQYVKDAQNAAEEVKENPTGVSVSSDIIISATVSGETGKESFAYPRVIPYHLDNQFLITYLNKTQFLDIDESGAISISDLSSEGDSIISGGQNLFPAEVDGRVFVFYKKVVNEKYYINCREFIDNILALGVTEYTIISSTYGLYEPFFIDGVLYYSAEHDSAKTYQNIESVTLNYDSTADEFIIGTPTIVISGKNQTDDLGNTVPNSRPGSNAITRLVDGSYLMLFESNINNYNSNYRYVVQYCYSRDLLTWTVPKTLFRENGGYINIPYITTSNDGTVLISYHTRRGYWGAAIDSTINKRIYKAFASNNAVAYGDELYPNKFTEYDVYRNKENEWTGGWGSSFVYKGIACPIYMVGNNETGEKHLCVNLRLNSAELVSKTYLASVTNKNAIGNTMVQRTQSGHIRAATPTNTSTTSDGDVVVTKKWIGNYVAANIIHIDLLDGCGYNPITNQQYALTKDLYQRIHDHPSAYRIYGVTSTCSFPCTINVGSDYIQLSGVINGSGSHDGSGFFDVEWFGGLWRAGSTLVQWQSYFDSAPCLIEGTSISMADGSKVAVEDIQAGDIVQSYNPVTKEKTSAVVFAAYKTGSSNDFDVYSFENGKYITAYGIEGFYENTSGAIKDLQKIEKTDELVCEDLSYTYFIVKKKYFHHGEKKRRYSLVVSNNLYFANGILLGHSPYKKYWYMAEKKAMLRDVPAAIKSVWKSECDKYNALTDFINTPEYQTEIASSYAALSKANEAIRVCKAKLTATDYKVQKYTEGVLSEDEWAEAKARRAEWRQAVNDNQELQASAKAAVREIVAKYRNGMTAKSLFEDCCTQDNALFETVKAYFTSNGGGNA